MPAPTTTSRWYRLKFKAVMAGLRWANMQEREGRQVNRLRGWSEHLFTWEQANAS